MTATPRHPFPFASSTVRAKESPWNARFRGRGAAAGYFRHLRSIRTRPAHRCQKILQGVTYGLQFCEGAFPQSQDKLRFGWAGLESKGNAGARFFGCEDTDHDVVAPELLRGLVKLESGVLRDRRNISHKMFLSRSVSLIRTPSLPEHERGAA